MLVICAFVVVEVALGMIFPAAAWELIGWLPAIGLVALVLVSSRHRSRSR